MIRRLAPLLVAGLALAACGGDDAAEPADQPAAAAPDPADEPAAAPADEPAAGAAADDTGSAVVADTPEALQFTAPLIGGGDIELTTLAGRPVLLWFWAPW